MTNLSIWQRLGKIWFVVLAGALAVGIAVSAIRSDWGDLSFGLALLVALFVGERLRGQRRGAQ